MLAWGKNKHQHIWKASGVFQLKMYTGGYSRPTSFTTDVLYICTGCGDSKTSQLQGHWTLEQLQIKEE